MNAIRHVSLTHYPPPPLSSLTVPFITGPFHIFVRPYDFRDAENAEGIAGIQS